MPAAHLGFIAGHGDGLAGAFHIRARLDAQVNLRRMQQCIVDQAMMDRLIQSGAVLARQRRRHFHRD